MLEKIIVDSRKNSKFSKKSKRKEKPLNLQKRREKSRKNLTPKDQSWNLVY